MDDDRITVEQGDDSEAFIQSLAELEQKAMRIATFRFGTDEGRVAHMLAVAAQRTAEETRREMEEKASRSRGESMNGEKLIEMLRGESFDLQQSMLEDYAGYVEINEEFLNDLIYELNDADLFQHVLEYYCSGITVTEDFLREVSDSFHDEDFVVLTMKKLYSGRNVSEAFLSDMLFEYNDGRFLRYLLENHYKGQKVSTGFIHEIVNAFESKPLTEFVIRNYY